jgi:hypothetical protein
MVAILLLLPACRPPDSHLWFTPSPGATGQSQREYRVVDSRAELRLSATTWIGRNCTRYDIDLKIVVRVPSDTPAVTIDPSSIVVIADGETMLFDRECPTFVDTASTTQYTIYVNLYLDRDFSDREGTGFPIEIVLNSFLEVSGQYIHVETIRAIENGGCEYRSGPRAL